MVRGKDGKEGAGWKGEERPARMFEFVRKGEGVVQGQGKKKGVESSDDEEEDIGDGNMSEDLDEDVDLEAGNNEDNKEENWEGVETDTDDQDEISEGDDD